MLIIFVAFYWIIYVNLIKVILLEILRSVAVMDLVR